MEARGRTIVQEMLLHSAHLIEQDDSNAAVQQLLASIGYSSTVAPLEASLELQAPAVDSGAVVTPLLPELFVRTRRNVPEGSEGAVDEGQGGPRVALQLIRDNDCFWCASAAVFPLHQRFSLRMCGRTSCLGFYTS